MKKIALTGINGKGKFALVDDEDFEYLNQFKWHLSGLGYAMRSIWLRGQNKSIQNQMHRELMNPPENMEIDHINGDTLDNRKENLRVCSHAENSKNRKMFKNNTSGHRGVHWDKQLKHWRVQFWLDGKPLRPKLFKDINEAIAYRAYLEKQYYGDWRRNSG